MIPIEGVQEEWNLDLDILLVDTVDSGQTDGAPLGSVSEATLSFPSLKLKKYLKIAQILCGYRTHIFSLTYIQDISQLTHHTKILCRELFKIPLDFAVFCLFSLV